MLLEKELCVAGGACNELCGFVRPAGISVQISAIISGGDMRKQVFGESNHHEKIVFRPTGTKH